jgi:anaphase-promoting complex subunit 2
LVASTLTASASTENPASPDTLPDTEDPNVLIWQAIETLGLIDRYETIIATVGYEFIEQHVLETCAGEWSRPLLGELRNWMSDKVVPWMLLIYARGATSGMPSTYISNPII